MVERSTTDWGTSQVLCLGELLFDYLADQPGKAIEQVDTWTPYAGGAPANVACALAQLGTAAAFLGCVGQDAEGEALTQVLIQRSVNIDGLQHHPHAPTRRVYVTRTEDGDRQFAGFGDTPTAAFADAMFQGAALPEPLFQSAQAIALGTLALAYPASRDAIHRALALAKTYGLTRWVDLNWRPMFWSQPELAAPFIQDVLSQADFLKVSLEEAELFFATTEPQIAAAQYPQAKGVLITAGEQGCRYWVQGIMGQEPAFPVQAVDTTGAGDAFTAGFLHQLCQSPPPDLTHPPTVQQMVRYANAVGALTTTRPGAIAAQPTAPEVEALVTLP